MPTRRVAGWGTKGCIWPDWVKLPASPCSDRQRTMRAMHPMQARRAEGHRGIWLARQLPLAPPLLRAGPCLCAAAVGCLPFPYLILSKPDARRPRQPSQPAATQAGTSLASQPASQPAPTHLHTYTPSTQHAQHLQPARPPARAPSQHPPTHPPSYPPTHPPSRAPG